MKNYEYPLDYSWSQAEMLVVIDLFNMVEKAYEGGVSKQAFLKAYQAFKEVITSVGEEKRLSREFEKVSGYSVYDVVKRARIEDNKKVIKIDAKY